jgi:hypothetical protein
MLYKEKADVLKDFIQLTPQKNKNYLKKLRHKM